MYDDLRNFFVECLLADHDAFRQAKDLKIAGLSTDLRLSIHTCSSMLHMADHVYAELAGVDASFTFASLGAYHSHLCSLTSEFKIITDCANAHKHRRLSRHNPALTSATSMEEVVVITEYSDEKGAYRIADKEIHIKLSDGSVRLMHESLDAVREMWWRELQRLGVLPISMNDVPAPHTPFPPGREQEGKAALLSIKLMRGERFKQTMILRKYNYHTSQVEPLDLSGATIQSSIYQDSHGFDLKIKHRETGEESNVEVPISDAEFEKIMALQNEHDKQVLMLGIARARGLLPEFIGDSDVNNV
jgi:hypothetical protein